MVKLSSDCQGLSEDLHRVLTRNEWMNKCGYRGVGVGRDQRVQRDRLGTKWEGRALYLPLPLLIFTPMARPLPRGQPLSLALRGWPKRELF